VSDIDTAAVDSLKVLDPERPIREAETRDHLSGKKHIAFSPEALVQNTLRIIGPRASAKGLVIRSVNDSVLPLALKGDAGRIRQVLLNLLSNAVNTRQRDAVYEFLEAAYGVVSRFNRVGDGRMLLRKLHRLDHRLKRIQEPYSAVIHYATGYTVDNRTRSKWSRLMRFAERTKKRTDLLEDFIRRNGGINECAARCRLSQ